MVAHITLALAVFGLIAPLTAQAQPLPSYARPQMAGTEQTIRGRIRSVEGAYHLTILDERGFVDAVQLHQGTVVHPSGLAFAPGMNVTISGYDGGSVFDAGAIDAPCGCGYTGAYPAPAYYGPGWWYPGFAYGYGPAFSLGLIVVGGGYTYIQRPFFGRPYFWGRPHIWRPFYGQPFYGQRFYGRPFYGYGRHGARPYSAPYRLQGGGFHRPWRR